MPVLFVIFIVGIIITLVLAILGAHGWGALCKFSAEASGREWWYYSEKEAANQVFTSYLSSLGPSPLSPPSPLPCIWGIWERRCSPP